MFQARPHPGRPAGCDRCERPGADPTPKEKAEPAGLVSVGVFLKEIEDFIFTDTRRVPSGPNNGFDGQYAGFELTTSANGGKARIRGIEFNYQQQFSFLPGWLSGFGVYGNYTYLETQGDYGGTTELGTDEIEGFLPRVGNVGLSYVNYGFDIRLQVLWRGEYLDDYSSNPARLEFQRDRTQVDLRTRYRINPRLNLFLEIENLTDEPLEDIYAYYPDRPINQRLTAPKVVFGVSGRF